MPNLMQHVLANGHQPLQEKPFDALDSLALSQIVYMPMEGLLDNGGSVTVAQLWAFLKETYPEGFIDPFQQKRLSFTEVCAQSNRYFDLTVTDYVNHIDPDQETQFCACTFLLPDGTRYIAIRGTDLTLAGWKEDLNMSFMRVPAQTDAVDYLRHAAELFDGTLMIGGHSKGGHLALFAAAHIDEAVQQRLLRVYSFDGPGVDEETLLSQSYVRIGPVVESYIPQSSVVGMLLSYHPVYQVVKSSALGILQHDVLTWHIKDGAFETLPGLDLGTQLADEALRLWIDRLSLEDRRLLTDTVFQLISTVDSESVDPLVQDFTGSTFKMFGAFRKLSPETRSHTRRMLGELFSSGASGAVRMLLPATLRRFVPAAPPVAPLAEQVKARQDELAEQLKATGDDAC